jgi:hypothetical protein
MTGSLSHKSSRAHRQFKVQSSRFKVKKGSSTLNLEL